MNGDQWISWLGTNHNINHNIFIINIIHNVDYWLWLWDKNGDE